VKDWITRHGTLLGRFRVKPSPPLYKAASLLKFFLSGSFTEFGLVTSVYSDAVLETKVITIKGFSVQ
jgi:hypothetical protein